MTCIHFMLISRLPLEFQELVCEPMIFCMMRHKIPTFLGRHSFPGRLYSVGVPQLLGQLHTWLPSQLPTTPLLQPSAWKELEPGTSKVLFDLREKERVTLYKQLENRSLSHIYNILYLKLLKMTLGIRIPS